MVEIEIYHIVFVIIVIFLIVIILNMQRKHTECVTHPDNDHCLAGAYEILPEPGDTVTDLIYRIEAFANIDEVLNNWRLIAFGAIVIALILIPILYRRLPTIWEFVVIVIVVFLIFYLIRNWIDAHVDYFPKSKVRQSIRRLREELGLAIPSTVGLDEYYL